MDVSFLEPDEEHAVEGDSFQVHKIPGGGWSQCRFQHNVEDNWIPNADQVAAQIASTVRRHSPRFVLVAEHEARACTEVLEQVLAVGAHGLSVTGLKPVVDALRKGHVETLVLADEPSEGTLLVGNSPLELGVDQHDMDALGIHGEVVPADRTLVAAAVLTSCPRPEETDPVTDPHQPGTPHDTDESDIALRVGISEAHGRKV